MDFDITALVKENQWLRQALLEERAITQQLREEIVQLKATVNTLQQLVFGQKSERRATALSSHTSNTNKINQAKANASSGRRPLPDHLLRVVVDHDLPPEQQYCAHCQTALTHIGADVTEQLDLVPAQLLVKQHTRAKYVCSHCQNRLVTAPLPAQQIDKGLAGSGLLAEVLINKYQDALPLYRQQQRWQRLGYTLTRSTLCDWVRQCARQLKPIVMAMQQAFLFSSPKLHTDDTTLPVLAPHKTHTGRLWTYVGGSATTPACVVYQYSPTRAQHVPLTFLQHYHGFLQADAYAGYDACYKDNRIIEVACWAHARRRFMDIVKSTPVPTLADELLAYIGQLYAIERNVKAMTDQQRYYARRRQVKPVLRRIHRWLTQYQPVTLPRSPLGQAINYCLNHWRALMNYLRRGYLSIDNNMAERAIKPLVIGRKNYLFAGSHQGAENAAVIYSLIETCKVLGINTYAYLKDVLERLPTTLMKNIHELLPQNWQLATAS